MGVSWRLGQNTESETGKAPDNTSFSVHFRYLFKQRLKISVFNPFKV